MAIIVPTNKSNLKLFRSDANVAETKVDLVDFKMLLLNNKQMPKFKGLFGMKLF